MQITEIARLCHEANRVLCESHGDMTQNVWEIAEDWQRKSATDGVGYRIANPDGPASAQHDAWMADKIADGWRYGETKDPEAKTHPCMVPFDQLPPEQQAKDRLFTAIVDACAPLLDLDKAA